MTSWSTVAVRARSSERRRSSSRATRPAARALLPSARDTASARSTGCSAMAVGAGSAVSAARRSASRRPGRGAALLLGGSSSVRSRPAAASRASTAAEVTAEQVPAHRRQLGHQVAVPAGRLGLLLERAQLAADFPQQVLQPDQAGLGRLEPALGPLLAPAELEDARRLLDDQAALLRAGVEDGVEVALRHDHVLLATDPGVGEQLLDVEQAARAPG